MRASSNIDMIRWQIGFPLHSALLRQTYFLLGLLIYFETPFMDFPYYLPEIKLFISLLMEKSTYVTKYNDRAVIEEQFGHYVS